MPFGDDKRSSGIGAAKRSRSSSPSTTCGKKLSTRSVKSKSPSPSSLLLHSSEEKVGASSFSSISFLPASTFEQQQQQMSDNDAKKTEKSIWSCVEPFKRRTEAKDFNHKHMFKFITWNVAGLRGLLKKDSLAIQTLLKEEQPDVLCLQETKLNLGDPQNSTLGVVPGYCFVDHVCRAKKGYSGTRTYTKNSLGLEWRITTVKGFDKLDAVQTVDHDDGDNEGRVLTTYFGVNDGDRNEFALALVNTYIPNSGMSLERLPYRYQLFDVKVRQHLCGLASVCRDVRHAVGSRDTPPFAGFIWTGDLNVAERDYDRYFAGTYKTMQKCSGFTPEERASFRETLRVTNAVDTFRMLYPRAGPVYTFWSARINGRARGLGWRLDYFVVSSALASRVVDCFTMPHVMGSDHCPVQMWLRK